ncbi:hypothetical protein [Streptacidiphilus fuscans]|uniref:Uncharacterized protein n=1 Tax=Streptacidiphilus fuscans TaxID=2789292 RepID=A0A931FII0_9ACTN|nr:hypothetical protein [Streptacidiphilus fuscans]MBF9071809.1 hypothetical protein [Streptacidiphilus fuscans]
MHQTTVYRSVRLIDTATYGASAVSLALALASPSIPAVLAATLAIGTTGLYQHRANQANLRVLAFLAGHPATRYEVVRDALELDDPATRDAFSRLLDVGLIDETRVDDHPTYAVR